MNILVACEESQAVTIELRKLGHRAFSCDIQECSGGYPEWHCCEDVLPLLNGNCTFKTVDGVTHNIKGKWDMIIAFPPCTHLAVSGAPHFEKKRADGRQREGIEFFCKFLEADCDCISIENPVNIISGDYIPKWFPDLAEKYALPIKPTQIIQPWQFGDGVGKSTCLWLKGLQPLVGHIKEKPPTEYKEWVDKKTGKKKRQEMWYFEALKHGADRGKVRSKTFPGVAHAMATQWAGENKEEVLEVKKVEDKVVVYECDALINLEALKEKEPELYEELLADYPCESATYVFKVVS
jgi:hypothetical protein